MVLDLTMAETSSLGIACRRGVEMFKTLLGEVDIKSIKDYTSCLGTASPKKKWNFTYLTSPVNIAAKYGQVELVKWLLEQGVDVPFGALFFAISKTKVDMVKELLNYGADANATGDGGWSALMLASLYGNTNVIRMLLDNDASVNAQHGKEFALLLAAKSVHAEAVRLLLECGAQVDLQVPGGATALTSAVVSSGGYGDPGGKLFKTIAALLEWDADVNLTDASGYSAFHAAVRIGGYRSEITVKQLLDKGGLIETISWDALRYLVLSNKFIEVLRVLLDGGLKINQQDDSGRSLLMHTTDMEITSLLLARKANVNLQDNDGRCALLYAVCKRSYDTADLLLSNGADLHLRAKNGESAASILQSQNSSMPWFSSEMVRYPKILAFLRDMPPTESQPVKRQLPIRETSKPPEQRRRTVISESSGLKETEHESCNRDRDQEGFVSEIKDAVVKNEVIGRKHAHSVFIGPPGTGKSSLMDSLLRRKRKAFSSSTGVSECVVIVDIDIDDFSSFRVATVTDPKVWEETDYDVSLVKQMSDHQEGAVISPLPHAHEDSPSNMTPPAQFATSSVPMPKADVVTSSKKAPSSPHSEVPPSMSKFSDDEITSKINTVIEKCGGFKKFQKSFSKSFSLYLRDAGGHMAFQDMLSIFILGPSIFIFVFRTDLDLKEKFKVDYRVSAGTSFNCINSSMTTEEAFLQFLASVYAMDTSGKGGVKTHVPLVFIVGTHKDKLGPRADEKIAELNEHFDSLIDSSHCFQDLVQYADRDKGQVIFTVDNTSESDEDFTSIRSKIYSLVSERSEFTIKYPVSYLLFALELQHEEDAFLGFDACKAIAAKYGIVGDQVSHLLYFLHYRVGVIQYFDVEGIVMIKPRVLFNKMTHLITTTFSRKSLTSKEVRDFQKGILTASLIKMVVGESGISSDILLKLLTRLHIIIPIAGVDEKYFIPCVLNHVNTFSKENLHGGLLPLSVQFKCEHCPKGLFGVLVAHLMTFESGKESDSHISFSLVGKKIFQDQVSFEVHSQYADEDEITLKNLPSHLEICFYPSQSEERDMPVNEVCCAVRQQIEEAISKSLGYLRYDPQKVCLCVCFKCDICHELHPVKKGIKSHKIYCKSARETRSIPPLGRFWYNEGTSVATTAALMCTPAGASRLSEHDFAWLFEKLCRYSFKWQEIGIGLQFTASELSIIQHRPTLLTTAPHSYLSAMLSDWLQWAPGDARGSNNYATLDSLRDAVDKAGLGRAAQEFNVHPQSYHQVHLATAVAIMSLLCILYQDLV